MPSASGDRSRIRVAPDANVATTDPASSDIPSQGTNDNFKGEHPILPAQGEIVKPDQALATVQKTLKLDMNANMPPGPCPKTHLDSPAMLGEDSPGLLPSGLSPSLSSQLSLVSAKPTIVKYDDEMRAATIKEVKNIKFDHSCTDTYSTFPGP